MAGGTITVSYLGTDQVFIAAHPGDYVYPSDVRIDVHAERLYTKAHGLAGGVREETWLFEYDLRARKVVSSIRVPNGSLTSECTDAD
jgi:hypothetical protein